MENIDNILQSKKNTYSMLIPKRKNTRILENPPK